eukprot:1685820-Amphidinium_carterae.2
MTSRKFLEGVWSSRQEGVRASKSTPEQDRWSASQSVHKCSIHQLQAHKQKRRQGNAQRLESQQIKHCRKGAQFTVIKVVPGTKLDASHMQSPWASVKAAASVIGRARFLTPHWRHFSQISYPPLSKITCGVRASISASKTRERHFFALPSDLCGSRLEPFGMHEFCVQRLL